MSKIQLMNVQRQHLEHAKEYEDAAISVLKSGIYIGGEVVEKFENDFANFCGCKYGISCGNGTDALVLALRSLNIGNGDEVITVAFTFFATAEAIAAVGAKPVFIDVDSKTYCMNPNNIESAITKSTKAIVVVHIYGHCADMDAINEIAKKHNLKVIEDCAQAAGSQYKGKPAGSLSDVGCFSFFPTKNLGCDGDGGIIVTNNEKVAKACKSLKVHGSGINGYETLQEQYREKNLAFPDNIEYGADKYHNYLIGYNSRLDAIQAAILSKKLQYFDTFITRRRKNAELYNLALEGTSYVVPYEAEYSKHSYYIYALQHKNSAKIMKKLQECGISCGTYYPIPLHLQGAFAYLGYKKGDLPITEMLCKTTFAIPVFPELYDDERKEIINALLDALE